MKNYVCLLLLIVILSACNRPDNSVRLGELDTLSIDTADTEMNAAIATARQSLHLFNAGADSADSHFGSFSLKINREGKQVWLYHALLMKSGNYMGELSTGEAGTQSGGEVITIDPESICDWMYLDGEKLVGGYTIRVQYSRMTAEEKKKFDDKNGLIF